jgi:VanZ family protein
MSNALRIFKYWVPAISAAAIISVLSTEAFGENHTATYIIPVLHWLIPTASPRLLHWLLTGIRKMAHIAEFSVFSMLVFRACRAGRQGWRPGWAVATLLIAVAGASLDEIHQIFVPGRGPSIRDVAIDTVGAMLAQAMVWLYATGIWGLVAMSEKESRLPGPSP